MRLVKPLTTQDLVEDTCSLGIELSEDFAHPEIVPNDEDWLAMDEQGHTWPVCQNEDGRWIT